MVEHGGRYVVVCGSETARGLEEAPDPILRQFMADAEAVIQLDMAEEGLASLERQLARIDPPDTDAED